MIVKEPKKLMKLTDKFSTGKYQGMTVEHVIDIDYEYIRWCYETMKGFALDRNARLVYQNVEESNREFNVRTSYSHSKIESGEVRRSWQAIRADGCLLQAR